jgi:Putative adhesin
VTKITAILVLCAGVAFAQERVTVPLSDPSRPATVHAHMLLGGISVRGANTKEVVVETRGSEHGSHERPLPPKATGMHRLDLGGNAGLDVTEENNVVNIKTTAWIKQADLVITVPYHSSLQLKSISNGEVEVEHVDGEIDVEALNGAIHLTDVSGSVVAHALNGEIRVTMERVDPSKPMSFSTLNGEIDVTLPANIRANVRMKTDNGEIYSDFDVKLESTSHAVASDSGDRHNGTYHIRVDRTLRGTINGGGPEYQFTSFNGQIFIRKR